MNRNRAILFGLMILLAAAPIALVSVQGNEEQQAWPGGQLTDQEKALARSLAEQELQKPEHNIQLGEKIYFTKIELLPDSQAQTSQREVVVTHYRYKGNQAVQTYIDLNTQQVATVKTETNLPTPLSTEEFTLAVELAKAQPQVAALFEELGQDLHIEAKLGWPARIDDETQPHRNVFLLFRVGRDYLSGPRVVVDLVTETVSLQNTSAQPNPNF